MKIISNEERILLRQLAAAASELLVPPTNMEELENREAAQQYFFVDDYSDNIHSFLNICNHFKINPLYMRKLLIQVQLNEKTETNFDNIFRGEIESARKEEIKLKTMNELIDEEIELLKDLIKRRVHDKYLKNKAEEKRGTGAKRQGF